MRYLLIFVILFFASSVYGQTGSTVPIFGQDQCTWFEEEDGSPQNIICGKMLFPNGTMTDNLDGSYSFSLRTSVPATQTSSCSAGNYAADSDYFYVCYTDNSWRRVELAAFAANTFFLLLDDGTSNILLSDGTSKLLGR